MLKEQENAMGLFSKPEVIILKESSDAETYLKQLEDLLPKVKTDIKEKIQKEIAITKAGLIGEENILFELKNSNMDMVVLRDIYLETKGGLGAQIDFVVITSKLVFIIECKNLFGNIEIDSKGNFIRTMEYGGKKHKEGIYSPITQNERHLNVIKECKAEDINAIVAAIIRKTFYNSHKSLVVLANPKTVVNDKYAKKDIKEQVLRADQLIKVIHRMVQDSREIATSKKDMLSLGERFLASNIDERKDYFAKYKELIQQVDSTPESTNLIIESIEEPVIEVESTTKTKDSLLCPKCGSDLVLRTAKKGNNVGDQFYGCAAFPKCRFILKTEV